MWHELLIGLRYTYVVGFVFLLVCMCVIAYKQQEEKYKLRQANKVTSLDLTNLNGEISELEEEQDKKFAFLHLVTEYSESDETCETRDLFSKRLREIDDISRKIEQKKTIALYVESEIKNSPVSQAPTVYFGKPHLYLMK
jgi:hypothetical protein